MSSAEELIFVFLQQRGLLVHLTGRNGAQLGVTRSLAIELYAVHAWRCSVPTALALWGCSPITTLTLFKQVLLINGYTNMNNSMSK